MNNSELTLVLTADEGICTLSMDRLKQANIPSLIADAPGHFGGLDGENMFFEKNLFVPNRFADQAKKILGGEE